MADSLLIEQVIERYGVIGSVAFDPSAVNANFAVKSILKVFCIVFAFFFAVPFVTYLVFMSNLQGAPRSYETSWKRLIQIYGYSLACFVPGSALLVLLAPFARAKWILTLCLTGMTCFYQYKEQIETCKKYLTKEMFLKLAAGLVLANFVFALVVKYFTSGNLK